MRIRSSLEKHLKTRPIQKYFLISEEMQTSALGFCPSCYPPPPNPSVFPPFAYGSCHFLMPKSVLLKGLPSWLSVTRAAAAACRLDCLSLLSLYPFLLFLYSHSSACSSYVWQKLFPIKLCPWEFGAGREGRGNNSPPSP